MDQLVKSAKTSRLICLCNAVEQTVIEDAIRRGCTTLSKIFDATTAGVGACGGSCQPTLRKMLASYLADGTFPENPNPPSKSQRERGLNRRDRGTRK